jgi:hypothetical protein
MERRFGPRRPGRPAPNPATTERAPGPVRPGRLGRSGWHRMGRAGAATLHLRLRVRQTPASPVVSSRDWRPATPRGRKRGRPPGRTAPWISGASWFARSGNSECRSPRFAGTKLQHCCAPPNGRRMCTAGPPPSDRPARTSSHVRWYPNPVDTRAMWRSPSVRLISQVDRRRREAVAFFRGRALKLQSPW